MDDFSMETLIVHDYFEIFLEAISCPYAFTEQEMLQPTYEKVKRVLNHVANFILHRRQEKSIYSAKFYEKSNQIHRDKQSTEAEKEGNWNI